MWGSGFLPSKFNGVALRGSGDPVLYVQNPPGVDVGDRRIMLDALNRLNQRSYEKFGDPDIQTRIAQYEMAFRMQGSVPELVDTGRRALPALRNRKPAARHCGGARRWASRSKDPGNGDCPLCRQETWSDP
jgi:hypothetical protein